MSLCPCLLPWFPSSLGSPFRPNPCVPRLCWHLAPLPHPIPNTCFSCFVIGSFNISCFRQILFRVVCQPEIVEFFCCSYLVSSGRPTCISVFFFFSVIEDLPLHDHLSSFRSTCIRALGQLSPLSSLLSVVTSTELKTKIVKNKYLFRLRASFPHSFSSY